MRLNVLYIFVLVCFINPILYFKKTKTIVGKSVFIKTLKLVNCFSRKIIWFACQLY